MSWWPARGPGGESIFFGRMEWYSVIMYYIFGFLKMGLEHSMGFVEINGKPYMQ